MHIKLINDFEVEITKVEVLPRYYGRKMVMDNYLYDEYTEDLISDWYTYLPCNDREGICKSLRHNEVEFADDEDITLDNFAKKVPNDYECYILGAYIHSGVSFSLTKCGDNRCRFDSSNFGFVAFPKGRDVNAIVKELDALWNGCYEEWAVIDRTTDDIVWSEIINTDDYKYGQEIENTLKEKYKVDMEKVVLYY